MLGCIMFSQRNMVVFAMNLHLPLWKIQQSLAQFSDNPLFPKEELLSEGISIFL